jgi:putative ABC transport system ATP-binding protein
MSRPGTLEVRGLTKTYEVSGRTVCALRNVSFSLEAGATMAVTGYSGSGKSTLLGLLGGLDRPTSGDVYLEGIQYSTQSEGQLGALRRRKIGFVFQTFNLLPALTAAENVLLAARISGLPRREATARTRDLLERVGMSERAGHRPAELSGGEQQRVAIARSLVPRPILLLADEPTGDLDSENGRVVSDLLFELTRVHGSICVMATHNLELASRAGASLVLRDGAILEAELSRTMTPAHSRAEG